MESLLAQPVDLAIQPFPAKRTVSGDTPDVLRAVLQPDVAMAVWQRDGRAAPASWVGQLPDRNLPHGRVLVTCEEAPIAIRRMLADAGVAIDRDACGFIADVCRIVRLFSDIAGENCVDLRLETIAGDACWKFHRDWVPLRLLCTYRGPGTQYVPPCHAHEALSAQGDYRGPLLQMPLMSPAIFRGARSEPGGGVVHRSPPIAGQGVSRLLLCLNLPSATSPERFRA
mgnify:CR=1 FL=1